MTSPWERHATLGSSNSDWHLAFVIVALHKISYYNEPGYIESQSYHGIWSGRIPHSSLVYRTQIIHIYATTEGCHPLDLFNLRDPIHCEWSPSDWSFNWNQREISAIIFAHSSSYLTLALLACVGLAKLTLFYHKTVLCNFSSGLYNCRWS